MEYSSAAAHHMAPPVPYPYYESSVASSGANAVPLPSYFHSLYSNPNPNPNDNPSSDPNTVGYYAHNYSAVAAATANQTDTNYGTFQGYDYTSLAMTVGNNAVSATRLRYGATANGTVKKNMNINTAADLSKKMRKVIEGGAPADSIKVCIYCNVVCNSDKVFVRHCVGAKHVMLARGASSGGGLYCQGQGLVKSLTNKVHPMKQPNKPQYMLRCEICKVDCNSQEMFNSHIMGRKHKSKSEKPKAPMPKALEAPTNSALMALKGLDSDGGSQKTKKPEDLEAKKRKVIEGGAAANAVRICMLCNVVCNSETVFQIHCSGQKHKNAAKNQGGAAC